MRSPPAGEVLGIERIRAALGCALRWDTRCAGMRAALGYALRWAQKDEEGLRAPPTSLWTPIPPANAGEV